MINYIDLTYSQHKPLPYRSEEEFKSIFHKGWSFSNVYHFSEIRNIYLYLRDFGFTNLKEFTKTCLSHKLPHEKTIWNDRRILEHINALKNFKLISETNSILDESLFGSSKVGDPINESDLRVFKSIFFSYYRFKEMLSWLIDPDSFERDEIIQAIDQDSIKEISHAIFPFNRQSRFTDSFIFELKSNTTVYFIRNDSIENNEDVMRFWDVFIKWAQELSLIERFNLKNMDYQLANNYKSLSCAYFKKEVDKGFDLIEYIRKNYKSHYINIPKLIFKIALEFRYSISDIKNIIIQTADKHSEKLSLQRTSEIFIRNTEINFVPIVNDSYISHLQIN
ncbi:MAG TPA: hypothetical protein VGM30_04840 [Puia sp.]|jgi:hypothetical protein